MRTRLLIPVALFATLACSLAESARNTKEASREVKAASSDLHETTEELKDWTLTVVLPSVGAVLLVIGYYGKRTLRALLSQQAKAADSPGS